MESYLLQSSIALTGFYLLYRLMIIKETNQQMKRFMGLFIGVFCSSFLLMPSFQSTLEEDFPVAMQEALKSVDSIQSTLTFSPQEETSIWLIIYFIGVGAFTLRFLVGLGGIIRLILASDISRKWSFYVAETDAIISPFSFFNILFVQKGALEKPDLEPIILHEQYHKDQMHSVDAILFEILTILFWFNPFIWLLQRDVKASHEYLADDYVISGKGFDKQAYQDLLFQARTGISFKSVNYLSNQTSLKQRFNMMEKRKTHSKTSFLRAGIVLVAMALTVLITSFSIPDPFDNQIPDIKLFTSLGEVDVDKGISKNTDKVYLRMMPKAGSELAYRLSKVEVTLVSDGFGQWTMQGEEMFDFGTKLSEVEGKSALVFKIQEYMIKNESDQVERVKMEKPFYINTSVN